MRDLRPAAGGWLALQRARLAHKRHPEMGEISGYCFYATKLRFGQLAFDVGANHGQHAVHMLRRGARVVAIEPQADLALELSTRFPRMIVLATAVSDAPGQGALHIPSESDDLASLDASWAEHCEIPLTWKGTVQVPVTTLEALIEAYGQPALVKIDTEGFEHRVLRGLSRPVDQVLFEVHAALPDVAAEALQRLDELGRYAYSVAPLNSWQFRQTSRQQLLADLPIAADVYARHTH
jgi:FkbM family methyltransferase